MVCCVHVASHIVQVYMKFSIFFTEMDFDVDELSTKQVLSCICCTVCTCACSVLSCVHVG